MPPLLTSLLPCALGLGAGKLLTQPYGFPPWQRPLTGVGTRLSPNQRPGFLSFSPTAPNPHKGTGAMQTSRKKPLFSGGLEPKSDPRYDIVIAATVATHHACVISSPGQYTTGKCCLSPHFTDVE